MTRLGFIYIIGADGTGKSTQARLLIEYLQSQGIRCRHLWLRFPFFFSLPLLAYARWRGYSWHEVTDEVDHGYWDFRRSWLMRRVFPWVVFIDAALVSIFKVYLPLWLGYTIVCERYVLDMVVDLEIAIRDSHFDFETLGYFQKLLAKDALVIGMVAPESAVTQRKLGLEHDRQIGTKLSAYNELFQMLRCPAVESTDTVEQVNEQILELIRCQGLEV